MIRHLAALLAAALLIEDPAVAALSASTLAAEQQHHRLLVVFADSAPDPQLARQRGLEKQPGFGERDLRLIEVVGDRVSVVSDTAAALRRQLGVSGPGFHVLLIGKDGHVAMRRAQPIAADELYGAIDAMPMRQEEMRRRGR